MTDHSVIKDEVSTEGARWRRLPEERPAQILAAALEVFGEHGLADARLDDIAKRAGLSKGTIYLYFENKEALFREAVQQTVVARLDIAEEQFRDIVETPSKQLERSFRNWWEMLRDPAYSTIYRLVHSELHRFPELHQYYAEKVVTRARGMISAIISRGIAAGEFRAMDPDIATRMSIAVFMSHALWRANGNQFKSLPDDDTLVAQCTDFVIHALRPAPAPPATAASAS